MFRLLLPVCLALSLLACGDDDLIPPGGNTGLPAGDCGIDTSLLSGKLSRFPWMVMQGDKVCYENNTGSDRTEYVASVAKTFGALTFGMVNHDTNGDISPDDRASDWISGARSNATLENVLSMTSHTAGLNTFNYDTLGNVQINQLSEALNKAIKKHGLARGLDDYVHNTVMPRLGMTSSNWSRGRDEKIFAYSLYSTVPDMIRFGRLINNRGVLNGQRYLTDEWAHRQIHPANEQANGGYGLLTWLNAPSWKDISGTRRAPDVKCAPLTLRRADFDSAGNPRGGKKDVGVWLARGIGGHFLLGHPGLDMVMAIKGYSGRPDNFWQEVMPAFAGAAGMSVTEFCRAYSSNQYSRGPA